MPFLHWPSTPAKLTVDEFQLIFSILFMLSHHTAYNEINGHNISGEARAQTNLELLEHKRLIRVALINESFFG